MKKIKEDFKIVKEIIFAGSIVVVIVIAVLGGCSYLNDAAGIEEIIEAKTGIDIDLSYDTPED